MESVLREGFAWECWGGLMEKMRLNNALNAPIVELKHHWKDSNLATACDTAAWDLTQDSITSLDEAVELLRLAADYIRTH
jgi:hypothetical protein